MATKSKNTQEQLKKTVESIAQNAKKIEGERGRELEANISDRVRDLSNRIVELPGFSLQEFLRITKIGDQTFRTWRNKGVDNPHSSNLNAIRRYLRIDETDFNSYLNGSISLDKLWESRNNDLGAKADVDRLVSGFALLTFEDKLEVLQRIPNALSAHYIELTTVPKEKEIEYVALSPKSRERLKELLKMSLLFKKKSFADLARAGVDGALLDSIESGESDAYAKDVFLTLVPYLCPPLQWVDSLPVIDPNGSFGEDLEGLLKELEA